jgi:hypothetical protein
VASAVRHPLGDFGFRIWNLTRVRAISSFPFQGFALRVVFIHTGPGD